MDSTFKNSIQACQCVLIDCKSRYLIQEDNIYSSRFVAYISFSPNPSKNVLNHHKEYSKLSFLNNTNCSNIITSILGQFVPLLLPLNKNLLCTRAFHAKCSLKACTALGGRLLLCRFYRREFKGSESWQHLEQGKCVWTGPCSS